MDAKWNLDSTDFRMSPRQKRVFALGYSDGAVLVMLTFRLVRHCHFSEKQWRGMSRRGVSVENRPSSLTEEEIYGSESS